MLCRSGRKKAATLYIRKTRPSAQPSWTARPSCGWRSCPGGVLAAVLYSGKVIGDAEKQAALAFFKALPLTRYTVLVCEFANWAQTAPLPCFVIKK